MNTPKNKSQNPQLKKRLIIILFALYIFALIWIIIFKCGATEELNIELNLNRTVWERLLLSIVPFKNNFEVISNGGIAEALALIFNVVCFVPFGSLLCFLVSRKAAFLSGLAFSLGVEIFQLFSAGVDLTLPTYFSMGWELLSECSCIIVSSASSLIKRCIR